MARSRYQQRSNTCGVLLLTLILLTVVIVLWMLARREPEFATVPTPTATPTFAGREAIAMLPTSTPHLRFSTLPTFTITPTATNTPTITPTPTLTPTPTPTPAPTLEIEIGAGLINVRQGPGTDFETQVILGEGEVVHLTGRTEDNAWVEVRMANGERGWVLGELLARPAQINRLAPLTPPPSPTATLTPSPTTEPPPQVGTQGANLRSGPGQEYDVVAQLPPATRLLLRGRNEAGDWLVVSTEAGEEGWLFAELVLGGRSEIAALPLRTPPPTPTPRPATPTPEPIALAAAVSGQPRVERKVLANYFTWYSDHNWDDCNISAGDNPLVRYNSDDPNTIARQVQMARDAGIDGFTMQWVGPGDRTDRNFAALLDRSQGSNFQSTVVSLAHYWSAGNQGAAIEGIRYLIDRYANHPNFLKVNGKPVIFFEGVDRVPRAGGSAQSAWTNIRAQIDPNHTMWWIAEGLDTSYLSVFDGMWVYNVTHATSPNDYVKASRWGGNVRAREQQTGQPKLWVATLMPGSDDSRASCRQDVRSPAPPRVRSREDGNFYRATFNAAVQSNPDLIWINSFNEWVEGTYIEPSRFYGDAYLNLTREMASQYKGG